jgi:hypothetical protein
VDDKPRENDEMYDLGRGYIQKNKGSGKISRFIVREIVF